MTNQPHDHDLPDNDSDGQPRTPESDPYRAHLAQSWWPPPPLADAPPMPPAPAPQHLVPPASYDPYRARPAEYSPSQRSAAGARPASGWRTVGVAVLGLIGGFLAAIVLQDIIGVAFIRGAEGSVSVAVALLIAALIPVLSVAGVVVALLIDRAARRRERTHDDHQ